MKLYDYGYWTVIEDDVLISRDTIITTTQTTYKSGLLDINYMLKYHPNAAYYFHIHNGIMKSAGPLKIKIIKTLA